MPVPLLHVTSAPLALEPLVLAVAATSGASELSGEPGTGAVATFVGVVRSRNQGRQVVRLEYEAHETLALRAFERIQREVAERWPVVRLALHHRIGRLEVGEASVAIAAASPHRADAFAACRYAIERVKQIAPIWKHEYFEGGDVWIEGAVADPDDESARSEAMARACA
jgi:molybdopterin synthase catalytic subunit